MLIVFCGIDGAGKTTQIGKLADFLESKKVQTYMTKQPTDWYRNDKELRDFLEGRSELNAEAIKGLALFSAADKVRHMQYEVLPKLDEGKVVISDRYTYSAYSYFLERGITDIEWLKSINDTVVKPDIIFYLDVPADVAYTRIYERDGNSAKKEEKDIEFLEKVRENFLKQPWGKNDNYYVIDTTKDSKITEKYIQDIVIKYI